MKWTPARMALVSGVGFLALVAIGVAYVANADPHSPATVHAEAAAASPTPAPTPTLLPFEPGAAVTMSARPSPTPTPKPKRKPRPTATPTPTPTPPPPPTLNFVLGTFNMLGASHTAGKHARHGFASGTVRAGRAAVLLGRHHSDVVGFQELQTSQLASLRRHTNFDFYPGFSLGSRNAENSIGWRRDKFALVESRVIKIPYFDGGLRAMPVVKLRSLSTGLEAWFTNFHNPAETSQYHHQQKYRTRATVIEKNLVNGLIRTSGLPVFLTGDMNERASFFCRFTDGTPMVAAHGGSNHGRCLADHPRAVDWIFGSPGAVFTDYHEDRSHLVDITTDHPVVYTTVTITGQPTELPSGLPSGLPSHLPSGLSGSGSSGN